MKRVGQNVLQSAIHEALARVIEASITACDKRRLRKASIVLNKSDLHESYFVSLLDDAELGTLRNFVDEELRSRGLIKEEVTKYAMGN